MKIYHTYFFYLAELVMKHFVNLFFSVTESRKVGKVLLKTKNMSKLSATQPEITYSKLTIETLEQGVKYIQI